MAYNNQQQPVLNPMMEQPISVPRRELDVEDYVDVLRRHRSWILGPALLGLVVGVVTAFLWPDSYRSTGAIRVVPPQVPSRLVQTNISEEMTQKINAIYQAAISRTNLTNLIQTYNLYPDLRKRYPLEDVLEEMRKNIDVSTPQGITRAGKSIPVFTVSFSYSDKRITQKVTSDLVSRFMNESVQSRSTQSIMTTEFLKDQVSVAKRDLDAIEQRIGELKTRNPGQMPDRMTVTLSRISALENALSSLGSSVARSHQDKLGLETQLRIYQDQLAEANAAQVAASAPPTPNQTATIAAPVTTPYDDDIAKLQGTLAALRTSYTEDHPDVQRVGQQLEQKKRAREQMIATMTPQQIKQNTPVAQQQRQQRGKDVQDLQATIARVQSAIQAKDMETEDLNRQITESRNRIRSLQASLDTSPGIQQDLLSLMRDQQLAQGKYESLKEKLDSSSMATDLEKRQQGETLEILEQPMIPTEPYAPKRPLIIFAGLGIGFVLGAVLAGVREMKDASLKNLKDVRAYTKLTVLGSIPLLENDFVIRRRRRMAWLAWSAASLLGLLMVSGSVIYYYSNHA